MDYTKKVLNIAIAISMVVCSFSLLVFSTRENKAMAQTTAALPSGIIPMGPVLVGSGFSADFYVLGYDPKNGNISVLGKINSKDVRDMGR